MSVTVYGLPTHCPQCETAKRMLDTHGIEYTIGDVRTEGMLLAQQMGVNLTSAPLVVRFDNDGTPVEHMFGANRGALATLIDNEKHSNTRELVGSGTGDIWDF